LATRLAAAPDAPNVHRRGFVIFREYKQLLFEIARHINPGRIMVG
jgi:hypothetical protein